MMQIWNDISVEIKQTHLWKNEICQQTINGDSVCPAMQITWRCYPFHTYSVD